MKVYCKILLVAFFLTATLADDGFQFKATASPNVRLEGNEGDYQILFFDEDNDPPAEQTHLVILEFTDEQTSTPSIEQVPANANPYFSNLRLMLDPQPDKKTFIIKATAFDYESLLETRYAIFNVKFVQGGLQPSLQINLFNLDDTPPQLTVDDCAMDENDIDATCVVNVRDPDGFLDSIVGTVRPAKQAGFFAYRRLEGVMDDVKQQTTDLYLLQELDFETSRVHSFTLQLKDGGDNTSPELTVIVMVGDMPDMPPEWISYQFTYSFLEKAPFGGAVLQARDGDYGLDWEINYRIQPPADFEDIITVNEKTGELSVTGINRDAGYDIVKFQVFAYEANDTESIINTTMTFMVEDIDDNVGVIEITSDNVDNVTPCKKKDEKCVRIMMRERYSDVLNDLIVEIDDIDAADNSIYTTLIEAEALYEPNFQIIPARGYGKVTFTLNSKDNLLLDFEDENWKEFDLVVKSIGMLNDENVDSYRIEVELIDWNDETPIFNLTEYNAQIYENVKLGEFIIHIQATDKDAEDKEKGVKHVILSKQTILGIEEFGGDVKTVVNDAFDYEKQTTVVIQIQASDNADPAHTAITQLTIEVLDVNDTPPQFTEIPLIEFDENQAVGYVVTQDKPIKAFDIDTNNSLSFAINWNSDATYGLKNLRRVSEIDFEPFLEFLNVEGERIDDNNFEANLIIAKEGPDYEIFDTLFLQLIVTDDFTEENINHTIANIMINIGNVNDNAPEFSQQTKDTKYSITEGEFAKGTLVGIVTAIDIDNLEPLVYSISYDDEASHLPDPEWLTIDSESGRLLLTGVKIDSDEPVRPTITYKVTAADGDKATEAPTCTLNVDCVHETPFELVISITDVNNQKPQLSTVPTIKLVEDFYGKPSTNNGEDVIALATSDKDRTEPFHWVTCSILQDSSQVIRSRFTVRNDDTERTSFLAVDLKDGATLDREGDENGRYEVSIQCKDNPNLEISGIQNVLLEPIKYQVELTDLNDWTPTIETTGLPSINENAKSGAVVGEIQAEDRDEGVNAQVTFNIESVTCVSTESDCQDGEKVNEMFELEASTNGDSQKVKVIVKTELRDLYGSYDIEVRVTDKPAKIEEALSSTAIVPIEVKKYNFVNLKISEPSLPEYLLSTNQVSGQIVLLFNDERFPKFESNLENKYKIVYKLSDENGGNMELFDIKLTGDTTHLYSTGKVFNENEQYFVTLVATITDGEDAAGESDYTDTITIKVIFFDVDSTDPTFVEHAHEISLFENDITPTFDIPQANYETDFNLTKNYAIEPSDTFAVDPKTGEISFKKELDFEVAQSHDFIIYASHLANNIDVGEASQLNVHVTVKDVNDNAPVFDKEAYTGTVLVGTYANTVVVNANANDVDTVYNKLTYAIIEQQLNGRVVSDLTINTNTGAISINRVITAADTGNYDLKVTVTDEHDPNVNPEIFTPFTTTVDVNIVIVSNDDTVGFKFENELSDVGAKLTLVETILKDKFSYETHCEAPSRDNDASRAETVVTNLPVYFIDDLNTPVAAENILSQVVNLQNFTDLKKTFLAEGLSLLNFESQKIDGNMEEMLKMWLISVSVVLGGLCILLTIGFILKTRSLNRRLNGLSKTDFGSQESGLNRAGLAIPNANRNAAEGANPVFNNQEILDEYDKKSIASGDSDLIGVEDNPEFDIE